MKGKWVFLLFLVLSFKVTSLAEEIFDHSTHAEDHFVTGRFLQAEGYTLRASSDMDIYFYAKENQIVLTLQPVETSQPTTSFTLEGLKPETIYHVYKDDLHNHEILLTEEEGSYSFQLETSVPHVVILQPAPSTKFIRDDATGGDGHLIGKWHPQTKTLTLTTDVFETIQIDSSGITINGNGHKITAPAAGIISGVFIPSGINDVAIKNCEISKFTIGVFGVQNGRGHEIKDNYIHDTAFGVLIQLSDFANVSGNKIERTQSECIRLFSTSNSIVKNNNLSKNPLGLPALRLMRESDHNQVKNNEIKGDSRAIVLAGAGPFPNGPFRGPSFNEIKYNKITSISSVGSVQGVYGIFMFFGSNNNEIIGNQILMDRKHRDSPAILMDVDCRENLIMENTIVQNGGAGISTDSGSGVGCHDNTIKNNSITGADSGVIILLGHGNVIEGNLITHSGASRLWLGDHNTFAHNVVENGQNFGIRNCNTGGEHRGVDCDLNAGLHLSGEQNSVVTRNTIRGVVGDGVVLAEMVRQRISTGLFETTATQYNEISHNVVTTNGKDGIHLISASSNPIFLNDIHGNAAYQVKSNEPAFIDDGIQGNYWGRTSPPLFIPGVDSNSSDVMDRYPFGSPVAE